MYLCCFLMLISDLVSTGAFTSDGKFGLCFVLYSSEDYKAYADFKKDGSSTLDLGLKSQRGGGAVVGQDLRSAGAGATNFTSFDQVGSYGGSQLSGTVPSEPC